MTMISVNLLVCVLYAVSFCTAVVPVKNSAVDQPRSGKAEKCLTRFQRNPNQFANCTSRVCFIFLEEGPYIQLDPSMDSEDDQILFPCNAPSSTFPQLGGAVFSIHNATSVREASCVWAGKDCNFHDLTAFLTLQSRRNVSYQFAATGLLLESTSRVTDTLYPSSSIVDSQLVIIGPVDESGASSSPVRRLLRPFRRAAWVLFSAMIAVFMAVGLLMAFVFITEPIRWHTLLFQILGEPVDQNAITVKLSDQYVPAFSENSSRVTSRSRRDSSQRTSAGEMRLHVESSDVQESRRRMAFYRAALFFFRAALSTFLIIFILFYEIAIVNFLFIQNTRPEARNIGSLSQNELSRYSVLKESILETVWSKTVDPYGTYNSSAYPWYRCSTPDDCFDKALDKSHAVKLVVTFEIDGNYQLLKRGACHKLTMYKTDRRLYSFGAGWLYGLGVSMSTRRRIDRDILDLRLTGKIRRLLANHMGKKGQTTCSDRPSSISAAIIGLATLVLVGPSLCLLTIVLCAAGRNGRNQRSVDAELRTSNHQR